MQREQKPHGDVLCFGSKIEQNRPPCINGDRHHVHTRENRAMERLIFEAHYIIGLSEESDVDIQISDTLGSFPVKGDTPAWHVYAVVAK